MSRFDNPPYYISAYGLAVKRGFNGTLEQWLDSLKGNDGKSAYEVAKELGYSGTAEEWLASLKGDKGDKGDKGEKGDPGEIIETELTIEQLEAMISKDTGSAKLVFAAVVSSFDGYKDTNGDLIQRPGCKVYRLMMDENEKLYGKTVRIKTYAYGDMVYGWQDHGQYIPINPDADIEENPKSGIREFEVTFPEYDPDNVYHMFDVSFCENTYTDFAIYEKKGTIWEELKKLQSVEGYDAFESVLTSVKYEKQNLTPAQQAQARENIGVAEHTTEYYSTEREELSEIFEDTTISHENLKKEKVWGLYNSLVETYPDEVQRNDVKSDDGSWVGYEYIINAGNRSDGVYTVKYGADKKPKFLVMSGIHGTERKTVLSTYKFIRDVLERHNVPQSFGAEIHVLPIGTPEAFDAFTRWKNNKVDINRNFDNGDDWEQAWFDDEYDGRGKNDADGNTEDFTNGQSAASEKETQAIQNWLKANKDADLFLDFHNSGALNEIVVILGDSEHDATDMAKKVALQGVGRVVPFWRDVIGYPPKANTEYFDKSTGKVKVGNADMIYVYSASASVPGSSLYYAQNLGIPCFAIETPSHYASEEEGTWQAWANNKGTYPPEPIAAGAEALGNILIEMYNQSFASEVNNDMKEIDSKIEDLAEIMTSVSKGFRIERGVIDDISKYVVADGVVDAETGDVLPATGKGSFTFRIPCSNGAKTIDFHADNDTLVAIRTSQGTRYLGSLVGNFFAPNAGQTGTSNASSSYMTLLTHREDVPQTEQYNNGWLLAASSSSAVNTDGVTFTVPAVKEGTYNWTAYYWNE